MAVNVADGAALGYPDSTAKPRACLRHGPRLYRHGATHFARREDGGRRGSYSGRRAHTATRRLGHHHWKISVAHSRQRAGPLPAWAPGSQVIYFSSSRGGTPLTSGRLALTEAGYGKSQPARVTIQSLTPPVMANALYLRPLRLEQRSHATDLHAKPGESSTKNVASDSARNEFGPAYSPDGTHLCLSSPI